MFVYMCVCCILQKTFLSDLCEVSDFHEQLQLEEYIAVSRKEISIEVSLSEITSLQKLLLNYKDGIVSTVCCRNIPLACIQHVGCSFD